MNSKPWFEMNLKIVIIGDPSVGKTSLLTRIIENKFERKYTSTLGVDFSFKELEVRDSRIKLQIWDTAGQEKYRSLITSYYKHTDGIIMVFDLTDMHSFQNLLTSWINHVTTYLHEQYPKLLILGNKKDLENNRSIVMNAETVKLQLESHENCLMRDLDRNDPLMHGDDPKFQDFNVNGGNHLSSKYRLAILLTYGSGLYILRLVLVIVSLHCFTFLGKV